LLKRIRATSIAVRLLLLALAALVLFFAGSVIADRLDRLPSLEEMNIGSPPTASFPIVQDEPWTPKPRSDGWAEAAENDSFILLIDPVTTQVAVQNKQSGYLWRSNPSQERVELETIKGTQLQNLQSPFILEYVTGTEIRRTTSNALDKKLASRLAIIAGGVQVTYTYEQLSLSFVMQYVLTDDGFEVLVPEAGLREDGEKKFYAINPLPFFGAPSGTEEEGYLFVPDGPGGLIHYDYERPSNVKGYEFPIYGDDPAQMKEQVSAPLRETISYPVFGLKRGNEAYAAIVKEGRYNAKVKVVPAGSASSYHSISANFTYREEYGRKFSGLTNETVRTMEAGRVQSDRRVEYRLLSGDEADYVGMAHAYRDYLEESGGMPTALQPVEHVPLKLTIIGGGTKPKFGGYQYETATTFAQAESMVQALLESGADNISVNVAGWQSSGRMYTDDRLPISKGMGGASGARTFAASMHEWGVHVLFDDFIGWKTPEYSAFTMKKDGVRSIDSTVLQGRFRVDENNNLIPGLLGDFIVKPPLAVRSQKEVIDALKKLGIDGIHYVDGPGNLLSSDYDPDAPLSRGDSAFYYGELLDYTRAELGMASVLRGNDYSLGHTDWVQAFPMESSYDLMIDSTVPFYPIAVHGSVEYSGKPGNLRSDYEAEFLKAIEYGAIPNFAVTHAPSRVLKDTDYEYVFSSEFAIWKDRIAEEYARFDQLSGVYHQRIANHEQLAEGIYATTYEDGTKVIVDYNTLEFRVEGGEAG